MTPFKALSTVCIIYFTRQFIAGRRLTEFSSLELDKDEDTEYIDNKLCVRVIFTKHFQNNIGYCDQTDKYQTGFLCLLYPSYLKPRSK